MGREGEGRRGEKSWLEGREEIRKGEMKSKRRSRKKKRRTYLKLTPNEIMKSLKKFKLCVPWKKPKAQ